MNLINDVQTLDQLYYSNWDGDISYFIDIPILEKYGDIVFNTFLEYRQKFSTKEYTINGYENFWYKKPFIVKDPNVMIDFIMKNDDYTNYEIAKWFRKNIHTDFGDRKLTIWSEISDLTMLSKYFILIILCGGVYRNWSKNVITISDPNILHEFIYHWKETRLGYDISWVYTLGICIHFIDFDIKDLVPQEGHDEFCFWKHWLNKNAISQLPISIVIDYFHVKPLPLNEISFKTQPNDRYDTVVDAIIAERTQRCIYLFLWIFDDILPLEVVRWMIFPYLPRNQTNIIRKQ